MDCTSFGVNKQKLTITSISVIFITFGITYMKNVKDGLSYGNLFDYTGIALYLVGWLGIMFSIVLHPQSDYSLKYVVKTKRLQIISVFVAVVSSLFAAGYFGRSRMQQLTLGITIFILGKLFFMYINSKFKNDDGKIEINNKSRFIISGTLFTIVGGVIWSLDNFNNEYNVIVSKLTNYSFIFITLGWVLTIFGISICEVV